MEPRRRAQSAPPQTSQVPLSFRAVLLPPVAPSAALVEANAAAGLGGKAKVLRDGPRRVLSNFVNGVETPVVVLGGEESSSSFLVREALRDWTSYAVLGGATEPVLRGASMKIEGFPFLGLKIRVTLTLQNPLSVPVTISYLDLVVVNTQGVEIGAATVDWRADPVVLAPEVETIARPFDLRPVISGQSIRTLFATLTGLSYLSAVGVMNVVIDHYPVTLDIAQARLPAFAR